MQLVCLIIYLLSIPFGTENRFADMILMIMVKFAYPYHLNIHIIWNREQDPDVDDHDQDNKYVDQFPMIMEIVCQVASTLLPGSTYITIVRDPIDLFESLWSYASKLHCHHLILAEIWQDPKSAKPCSDMSE